MPHVRVKENEPFDIALRRFKRSCEKAGVLSEVRRREFYEKPTAVRKRKAAAAVKRHMKEAAARIAKVRARLLAFSIMSGRCLRRPHSPRHRHHVRTQRPPKSSH